MQIIRAELLIFFPSKLFFSGDVLKGYAELRLPTPMTIQQVKINLVGKEYYATNLLRSESTLKRSNRVFYEYSSGLEGKGSKKQEDRDFFGFKKTVRTKLDPGVYRYNFEIKLPDNLPPTYKTNPTLSSKSNIGNPCIEYEMKITCVNDDRKVGDLISNAFVNLGGSLLSPTFIGNHSIPFNDTRQKTFLFAYGNVQTDFSLASRVFFNGDIIMGKCNILNTSTKTITDVTLSLIQRVDCMRANSKIPLKSDAYVIKRLSLGEMKKDDKRTVSLDQTSNFKIPEACIESVFNFGGRCGVLVNITYLLKITAKTGTLSNDVDHEVIIYVANRAKHTITNYQQPNVIYYYPPNNMSMGNISAAAPNQLNQSTMQMIPPQQYPPQMYNNYPQYQYQYPQQMMVPPQQQQQYVTPMTTGSSSQVQNPTAPNVQNQQPQLQKATSVYNMQQQKTYYGDSSKEEEAVMYGQQTQVDLSDDISTAPTEGNEVTEYHEYNPEYLDNVMYPQLQFQPQQYTLPPVPLQLYEEHARSLMSQDNQQNTTNNNH